ncbi:hypothetical protein BDQ12DRAFT_133709 [Crucibulum laeve]|uniref:Uncharacterized protein n=1 Tax=Crucibulum laeve TaxID=68775 RepID=A0A5C3LYQ9_9AGAR|nr:hypothetical protein BDQ12DRAFT_133709 [Crucibulum laeve]
MKIDMQILHLHIIQLHDAQPVVQYALLCHLFLYGSMGIVFILLHGLLISNDDSYSYSLISQRRVLSHMQYNSSSMRELV